MISESPVQDGVCVHDRCLRPVAVAIVICLAAVLFAGVGWFAPNFVATAPGQFRDDPLGGDWLQEYTGGRMWSAVDSRARLYDLAAFRAAQHDVEQNGFAWNENKYFPPVYPPFWYAAVSPLSKVDYLVSAHLWLGLMIAAFAGSLLLLWRERPPAWLLAVLALSPPLMTSLTSGQKGTLLLLILTAAWMLFRNGGPFASGAVFGLIAFKPHLALPIALAMLIAGRWRWVSGACATVAVLVLACAAGGAEVCRGYIDVVLGMGGYLQTAGYRLDEGFSLWSAAHLAIGDATAARVVAPILVSLVLVWSGRYCRAAFQNGEVNEQRRAFAAMTLATVLVVPHFYLYDLAILLLPAALLTSANFGRSAAGSTVLPVALIAATMLGAPVWVQLAAATGVHAGVLMLLAALLAVLVCSPERAFFTRGVRVDTKPVSL